MEATLKTCNMETKREHPETEKKTYEELEKEFQDVLDQLGEEMNLERFSVEYDKLFTSLKKSHENEKKLMGKCAELKAEIRSNALKMEITMKLSQEDQNTILALKKETSQAIDLADANRKKQEIAEERIKTMQQELDNELVFNKQGAVVSLVSRRKGKSQLFSFIENLQADRDNFRSELGTLQVKFNKVSAKQNETEEDNRKAQKTIIQLHLDYEECKKKCAKEAEDKNKLGMDVKQLQEQIVDQIGEIQMLTTQCQETNDNLDSMVQQVHEQTFLNEKVSKELDELKVHNSSLQQQVEKYSVRIHQLESKYEEQAKELKNEVDTVIQLKQEITKMTKKIAATEKKLGLTQQLKLKVENQREKLKIQVKDLIKDIDIIKKENEIEKRKVNALTRERDTLSKNILKAEDAAERQVDMMKLQKQRRKTLVHEILNFQDEAQKQRKVNSQLIRERDHYINEAIDLKKNIDSSIKTLKIQELKIVQYNKKLEEAETNLKQQQNLCEATSAERNNYSNSLLEARSEISDMVYKMNFMSRESDKLKEEIKSKEAALVKQHQVVQQTEKEKEALKVELLQMKQQAQETKQYIYSQEIEKNRLLKIIADVDAEKVRQKKELDQVSRERDVCGSQLTLRNDERTLLSEEIKVQQAVMKKGELEYQQRLEDINLLNLTIRKLQNDNRILQHTASRVKDLEQKVNIKERELLHLQAKCENLQKELENPANVHSWVRLKASDLSTFELLQKIHSLQRLFLSKSEEVVEKELIIQNHMKLNTELKQTLARRPGPEAAEQVLMHKMLNDMTKQIKVLLSELNMYKSQAGGYKEKTKQLTDELQNMKKLMQKHGLANHQRHSKQVEKKQGTDSTPLTSFVRNTKNYQSSAKGQMEMLTDHEKMMAISGSMYKERQDIMSSKTHLPPLAASKVSLVGKNKESSKSQD